MLIPFKIRPTCWSTSGKTSSTTGNLTVKLHGDNDSLANGPALVGGPGEDHKKIILEGNRDHCFLLMIGCPGQPIAFYWHRSIHFNQKIRCNKLWFAWLGALVSVSFQVIPQGSVSETVTRSFGTLNGLLLSVSSSQEAWQHLREDKKGLGKPWHRASS